jgi:NTP pyrophosphatase (non-canonical NTP hydrolase)
MTFNEYQQVANKTALHKEQYAADYFIYLTLAVNGEAGELAEKVKKIWREKNKQVSPEDREEIKKEMGDVLWYLGQLSETLGFTLEDVAQTNLQKVSSRLERGALYGSGDNR